MPRSKKMRCQEPERKGPRKKSPHEQEGKAKETRGGEMAPPTPTTADPLALLSGPELRHPVNAPLRAQAMAELQRQRGNIYVQRLIRSGAIQGKLTVNPPDDAYEQEADRVATEVMAMPAPQVQRQLEAEEEEEEPIRTKLLSEPMTPLVQRQIEPEEEEEEEVPIRTKLVSQPITPFAQRQIEPEEEEEEEPVRRERVSDGIPEVTPDLEARIQAQKGGGQALDNKLRAQMESAFDAGLSDVPAHANAKAHSLTKGLRAKAFTTRKDIFFREGSYDPRSQSGKKLIGHELARVMQQSQVQLAPPPTPVTRRERGPEVQTVSGAQPAGRQTNVATAAIARPGVAPFRTLRKQAWQEGRHAGQEGKLGKRPERCTVQRQAGPGRRSATKRPEREKAGKVTAIAQREVIYFAQGMDQPLANQMSKLRDLALLVLDPHYDVKLAGHASTEGSLAFNTRLSERRALTVQSYLIIEGVDAKRITWRAFGERRPAAAERGPTAGEREEQRALNRRVEVKVVHKGAPSPLRKDMQIWVNRTRQRFEEAERRGVENLRRAKERLTKLRSRPAGKVPPIEVLGAEHEVIYRQRDLIRIREELGKLQEASTDPNKARSVLGIRGLKGTRRLIAHYERRLQDKRYWREKYRASLKRAQRALKHAASEKERVFWKEMVHLYQWTLKSVIGYEIKWLKIDIQREREQQGKSKP